MKVLSICLLGLLVQSVFAQGLRGDKPEIIETSAPIEVPVHETIYESFRLHFHGVTKLDDVNLNRELNGKTWVGDYAIYPSFMSGEDSTIEDTNSATNQKITVSLDELTDKSGELVKVPANVSLLWKSMVEDVVFYEILDQHLGHREVTDVFVEKDQDSEVATFRLYRRKLSFYYRNPDYFISRHHIGNVKFKDGKIVFFPGKNLDADKLFTKKDVYLD